MMDFPISFLDGLGTSEMVFLAIIAILLFGEKLPEVARTYGKKIVDFKKNIQGIQDELRSAAFSATDSLSSAVKDATNSLNSATDSLNSSVSSPYTPSGSSPNGSVASSSSSSNGDEDHEEPTAPKFEPPKADAPKA